VTLCRNRLELDEPNIGGHVAQTISHRTIEIGVVFPFEQFGIPNRVTSAWHVACQNAEPKQLHRQLPKQGWPVGMINQ